ADDISSPGNWPSGYSASRLRNEHSPVVEAGFCLRGRFAGGVLLVADLLAQARHGGQALARAALCFRNDSRPPPDPPNPFLPSSFLPSSWAAISHYWSQRPY